MNKLEQLLTNGLTLKEACMAVEAISSCAIEGTVTDEEGLKSICDEIIKMRTSS